jgi:hypothetical protein
MHPIADSVSHREDHINERLIVQFNLQRKKPPLGLFDGFDVDDTGLVNYSFELKT